jgi:hypothetical protein
MVYKYLLIEIKNKNFLRLSILKCILIRKIFRYILKLSLRKKITKLYYLNK